MYTDRYPTGLRWRHDGVGEGPPGPAPRQGRARAHPQRVTAAVPRSGHQPHRHGPTLRGGPGVQAHGLPALHRQGRTRRRIPAPIRSRRHARSVRPHRPHAPRTTPRRLRDARDHAACAPTSRRPSNSTTPNTPHPSTHATTRKPSPRGSPKPPAKPAPPTPNSSANNWRCSSTAPRPAPGSSTPNPSPPPPPSPPSSSTTPSPRQPGGVSAEVSGLLLFGWQVSDSPIRPRRPGRGRPWRGYG